MSAKELNVGDYVRTKDGKIFKWNKVCILKQETSEEYLKEHTRFSVIDEKDIKSSPNIIDLIQEGDYINGKLVTTAEDVYTTDNIYIGKEVFVNHDELIIEEDIENIVTHEMFESMKYKIGE